MPDLTYDALLRHSTKQLVDALGGDADRQAEASLLLQHASGFDRAGLINRAGDTVSSSTTEVFDSLITRRLSGVPVFRIIGQREFHGLDLKLSDETLEPRDDTEALVELAVRLVVDPKTDVRFADLGTGTGAIALALLSDLPHATGLGVDISEGALKTALENAKANDLAERFSVARGSWCEPLDGQQFDFLVSNPPYIASQVVDGLEREVLDHDPRLALDGGDDGLDAYRVLFASCGNHLKQRGFLAVEIGFDQRETVCELAAQRDFVLAGEQPDLGGRDRALAFVRAG